MTMATSTATPTTASDEEMQVSQYHWIDGTECPDGYSPGGYHPVCIGDVLKQRYHIVEKLGYGGYSTVWLAHDSDVGKYVALKIATAEQGTDAVASEIKTLKDLQGTEEAKAFTHPGRRLLPTVLDTFQVTGPNGMHTCYTTAPARDNLRYACESYLFSLPVARALAGGLAQAVAYIHSRGYVHGDLHLCNILAQLPPNFLDTLSVDRFYEKYGQPEVTDIERRDGQPLTAAADRGVPPHVVHAFRGWAIKGKEYTLADARIVLGDFGESFRPDTQPKLGRDCHTPQPMQPLEARFEPDAPLSFSADVWTLAIALWDLVAIKKVVSADFAFPDEIVAQYIDVFGPLPAAWRDSEDWREHQARFFDEQGIRRNALQGLWRSLEEAFDKGVQMWRRKDGMGELPDNERAAFLDLMRRMVVYDPAQRLTMSGVLQSEWMQQWALPAWKEAEAAAQEREQREAEAVKGTTEAAPDLKDTNPV